MLKSIIRYILLRGPILRWRIARQSARLERAYLIKLAAARNAAIKPAATTDEKSGQSPHSKLRKVIFIADVMWEREQIVPSLEMLCEVETWDIHSACVQKNSKTTVNDELRNRIEGYGTRSEPDLIFFYLRPSRLSEEAFQLLRSHWSCPIVGMNLDDRVEFFRYGILGSGNDDYERWIRHFDLNITSSLTACDWYRARGANVRYMPQGFNPDPRFRAPPQAADIIRKLSFVGSAKPERVNLIKELIDLGISPEIFGSGWNSSLWADDAGSIFRSSQINLGIGYALPSAGIANAKGRDIECPGTGACLLTTYHWEIANLFEVGKEVICYRDSGELIEMLSYYLPRPEECLRVAQAAHKRALSEHTWEYRLRSLFKDLGFNLPH